MITLRDLVMPLGPTGLVVEIAANAVLYVLVFA